MTFEKFIKTLEINKRLIEFLESDIGDFHDEFNGSDDITSIIFDVIKEEAIMLLLPLKDEGVGAIHFHIEEEDIIIINTNQPRCKMYFSAIHDLYHMKFQEEDDHVEFDIHLNSETYNTTNAERMASLFSASLLMPKNQLKKAYNTFANYSDDFEEILVKLMIKFKSPFEAVMLRLYETNIKKDINEVKAFMELSDEEVEGLMSKYYLSNHIMKPLLIEDVSLFESYKQKIQNKQLYSEHDLRILLEELDSYIKEITIGDKS